MTSTAFCERTAWLTGDLSAGVTEENLAFLGPGRDIWGDLIRLGHRVVYICGPADPKKLAADARAAGYQVKGNQHADRWSLRIRREGALDTLSVVPISRFFDDQNISHHQARRVMTTLGERLRRQFGQRLSVTPAATGFWCWHTKERRAAGLAYPPLPEPIRLAHVGTQGRFEVCPAVETIPALYCLDMRLAYAAAACQVQSSQEWRHEVGPAADDWRGWGWPEHDFIRSGAEIRKVAGFLGYTPARYRVRFRVPEGWGHVGLLPAPRGDGVHYPTWRPGDDIQWETWADSAEVRLAIEQGWHVEILERIYAVKPEGKASWPRPLRAWCEGLLAIREELSEGAGRHDDAALYRAACRNIILHTIGLFAGRTLLETRAVEREEEGWADWIDVPEDAERGSEIEAGQDILYQKRVRGPGYHDHPELAHQVWGLCRSWLLKRRRQVGDDFITVGALGLPREQVVGFAQDALYATVDPKWPDDGPGGYRVKGGEETRIRCGFDRLAPRNRRELLAMMGEADG